MIAIAFSASAATAPNAGPYIFTGTETLQSGNSSNCLPTSPLSISGDAVVSGDHTLYLHIKATSNNPATGIDIKNIVLQFGVSSGGRLSYVLLPRTGSYNGAFNGAVTTAGSDGSFSESITLLTGPLQIGHSGQCQTAFDLTMKPGINKALLKLFGGVL
jgi:hypothetical protein